MEIGRKENPTCLWRGLNSGHAQQSLDGILQLISCCWTEMDCRYMSTPTQKTAPAASIPSNQTRKHTCSYQTKTPTMARNTKQPPKGDKLSFSQMIKERLTMRSVNSALKHHKSVGKGLGYSAATSRHSGSPGLSPHSEGASMTAVKASQFLAAFLASNEGWSPSTL
jgi:hypothetical protein